MKRVAVIPARKGSKRLSGKNIREFCGRPLISYSIEAAIDANLFDMILVSTDSPAIASIARECGAEVPFIRPEKLSDDHTPIGEVFEHALQTLENDGAEIDMACCIFATAPMISPADIRRGCESIEDNPRFSGALAVSTFDFPIQRALRLNDNGGVEMIQSQYQMTRSQDLEEAFHDAGQFFWQKRNPVPNSKTETCPVVVDRYRVQDIDTPEDWTMAECQYRALELMRAEQEGRNGH